MSTYDAARIEKPPYLRLAPLRQGRGSRRPHVVGFDSEASGGQPILFQFSEGGGPADADLVEVTDRQHAALDAFMYWIQDHCRSRAEEHIVVGFNLRYEWTQLFGDLPSDLTTEKQFRITWEGDRGEQWALDVWNDRRYQMTLTNAESQRRVRILDASAFFPGSLSAVAAMVGVERKDDIDKEQLASLTRASLSDPVFRHYAAQDAVVTRLVGERIVEMHEEFDLPTCMTAPHFASSVFRRHFLSSEIPLPSPALEQAGLWSYHGGKNGFYLRQPTRTPAWSLDIVSAYPEAMRALPALEASGWAQTNAYEPGAHALWHVALDHRPCRYVGVQAHDGLRLARGLRAVWLTGYELDALLDHDEAWDLSVLDGWVLSGPVGGGGLVAFVDRFFAQKQVATGPARATAKLLLNGLYGKFFQKIPLGLVGGIEGYIDEHGNLALWETNTDPTAPYDYRAGGLYHPPVASLITGFVRAKVHRLEHQYEAIATSTDGFFSRQAPLPSHVGPALGQLTAAYGVLDIWRERLYAFDVPPDGLAPATTKAALHGFRGTADQLREIPLSAGTYRYTARHPITLREATKQMRGQRYRPGEFAALTFDLDLSA